MVGRSRALEIVLSGDDFDADIAERYGWVNRTLDDDRLGTPTAAELQSNNDMFFSALAQPGAQARRARVRGIGYGARSDFELNFGRYLRALGRTDHDDTGTQRRP